MQEQSKPLMRSLMYLHMNQTTNGSRAPLAVNEPRFRLSTFFIWLGILWLLYFVAAIVITNV